jgi:hypothetical protein
VKPRRPSTKSGRSRPATSQRPQSFSQRPASTRQAPSQKIIPFHSPDFPATWSAWVDQVIPSFVKDRFSPRESWKGKPFTREDAYFFFESIEELSDLFTEERPRAMPDYFRHPKNRSAYLLYFLPFQAAKFLTLYQMHEKAIQSALEHSRKTGVFRLADLGSGPGTASFALLLHLATRSKSKLPEKIELLWNDTNRAVMEDGRALLEKTLAEVPALAELRGRVQVIVRAEPWWKSVSHLKQLGDVSLAVLGHVLNEAPDRGKSGELAPATRSVAELVQMAEGGGVLIVEPAARAPSQRLSRLRDDLIGYLAAEAGTENDPERDPELDASLIWGPCLHAMACPLAEGRDWCHFSAPAQLPGKWFREFSKGLGSERSWLKFSYLWLASRNHPSPIAPPNLLRVISDPIGARGGQGPSTILLCEPNTPRRLTGARAHRGDLIEVSRSERD